MKGFKPSCRIQTNDDGDWRIMPPAGQITQIGEGFPVFAADEDDFFVSDRIEIGGAFVGLSTGDFLDDLCLAGGDANFSNWGSHDENLFFCKITEEITIPVGQGSAGVWGAKALYPHHIILGCVTRITQAPGGGATQVSVGPAANTDEFLQNGPVALGSTSISVDDGDGSQTGPFYHSGDNVIKVTTDADVTISDMKIRITTYTIKLFPPED